MKKFKEKYRLSEAFNKVYTFFAIHNQDKASREFFIKSFYIEL